MNSEKPQHSPEVQAIIDQAIKKSKRQSRKNTREAKALRSKGLSTYKPVKSRTAKAIRKAATPEAREIIAQRESLEQNRKTLEQIKDLPTAHVEIVVDMKQAKRLAAKPIAKLADDGTPIIHYTKPKDLPATYVLTIKDTSALKV